MITFDKSTSGAMGTIVSWDAPAEVTFVALRQGLLDAGFEEKYAKEMMPRNAFQRAAKDLSEERIIRRVEEDDDEIQFQFTREYLRNKEYEYTKECELYLNKDTGAVRGTDDELAREAHRLLIEHQGKRNCSDITRLIQKLFDERKGDLVSLRKTGGVYFVPDSHTDLVEQVAKLLASIGGTLNRFLIRFGDPATTDSVAEAMADHLLDLLDQLRQKCKGLGQESKPQVIENRANELKAIWDKLENYQGLMVGLTDNIKCEIERANQEMIAALIGRPPTEEELAGHAEPVIPPPPPEAFASGGDTSVNYMESAVA